MEEIKKIFCIQGISGAGKDTLVRMISKKMNIETLVSHTTRPMREHEVDGETYYFVKDTFFKNEADNFLELRTYNVWDGSTWYYGLHKIEVLNKPYSLFIVDRHGYEELKEKLGDKLVSIMIDADKEELVRRLEARGDNKAEINRRIEDDIKRFEGFKPDYVINNSNLRGAAKRLEDIILREVIKDMQEEM